MKYGLPIATFVLGLIVGFGFRDRAVSSHAPSTPTPNPTHITLRGLADLTGGEHSFSRVIHETCGMKVLPFRQGKPVHRAIEQAILGAAEKVALFMSREDSPARSKNRINEVSALFEDALATELYAHPDFSCTFPLTKSGKAQRSGYPDLRIEHLPSGTIAYLDPKLFAATSKDSTFRTFYFEPGGENSKITEDALHFLIGFPHDGETRAWTFGRAELVDLSKLRVTLKTEFSASNKEVYSLSSETKDEL